MAREPEPGSEPESPAPLCPCASPPLPSDTAAADVSAAVFDAIAEEAAPVPAVGIMEICSAPNGEAAAAVGSVAGAGADAAALAACNADAAAPVASEPSVSARLTRALLAAGVCAVTAESSAGAADAAEDEVLCPAVRAPAAAPLPDASDWTLEPDTGLGLTRAPLIGAAAVDGFAASAAADTAGGVPLVCAVAGTAAAGAGPFVAAAASATVAPIAASAYTGAPAAFCEEVVAGAALAPGSTPAEVPDNEVPGATAPATPAVAAPVAPATTGAAGPEASSSPSSRLGGAAGAPFGTRSRAGGTGTAAAVVTAGAAAAGGVTLPEGGNVSPLGLPVAGLAESSFRLCLAEARSSAPAKSRAPEALAVVSAEGAAFCELSCGGACLGTEITGVRMARMAAFMLHEVASDVPRDSATLGSRLGSKCMRLEVTDTPQQRDEAFVIAQTRAYNAAFAETDTRSLCVFARDDNAAIIGGLTSRTYWRYLDIAFLWVDEKYRGRGVATQLMSAAENEARNRGCHHVFLDTLSFQALGFYRKLGYTEFGRLSGFSGKHDRYWLRKSLE